MENKSKIGSIKSTFRSEKSVYIFCTAVYQQLYTNLISSATCKCRHATCVAFN